MKVGDMARESWSYKRLYAEGWVIAGPFAKDYREAGFRLRACEADAYAPGWLIKLDIYRWGRNPYGHRDRLQDRMSTLHRIADRVRERGDEDLTAAFALGGAQAVSDVLKAEGTL